MAQSAQNYSQSDLANIPRIWKTNDVDESEAFDYYREGICEAFMPLRPELGQLPSNGFQAEVQSHCVADSYLNLVSASSHQVSRGKAEIAGSATDCYFLNLQLGGQCRISQGGVSKALSSGEVGIFSGSDNFQLHHDTYPRLNVASLMLPKQLLQQSCRSELRARPLVVSRHPLYGRLICESMSSLVENITHMSCADRGNLLSVIVSLIEASAQEEDLETGQSNRVVAQLTRVKRIIRNRCTKAGFNVAECADEAGLSRRYIHRLFTNDEDSFGSFLMYERLNFAAGILQNSSFAQLPISTIAFDAGFQDQSHFSRRFRERYEMSPGAWRQKSRKDVCG